MTPLAASCSPHARVARRRQRKTRRPDLHSPMNDQAPALPPSADPAPLRPYVHALLWMLPALFATAFTGLLLVPRAAKLLNQAYLGAPPAGLRVIGQIAAAALRTWNVWGVAAVIVAAELLIPPRRKHVWRPRVLRTLAWTLNCVVLTGLILAWVQIMVAFDPIMAREAKYRARLLENGMLQPEEAAFPPRRQDDARSSR